MIISLSVKFESNTLESDKDQETKDVTFSQHQWNLHSNGLWPKEMRFITELNNLINEYNSRHKEKK